jgi:hypothetical protein
MGAHWWPIGSCIETTKKCHWWPWWPFVSWSKYLFLLQTSISHNPTADSFPSEWFVWILVWILGWFHLSICSSWTLVGLLSVSELLVGGKWWVRVSWVRDVGLFRCGSQLLAVGFVRSSGGGVSGVSGESKVGSVWIETQFVDLSIYDVNWCSVWWC